MKNKKNEAARHVDVVIDAMNTLRFLCHRDSYDVEKMYVHVDLNCVLIHDNAYFFQVCKELDRMPWIEEEEEDTESSIKYSAEALYRGVRIRTYLHSERAKEELEAKIHEYEAEEWERMQNGDDDDDEE